LDESLVEFKFLGVAIFVELEYEVRVEVERDADPFDDLLQNFESALGLNNSGLPQGLLQVVYYLDVSLLSLLDVFALPGLHSVTTARKIYKRTSHALLIIYDFFKQMAEKVTLLVYDITRGMAKGMSMMMIGQQVDAIYHTSIVVYGREYFFGGGICNMAPKTTPYGKPIQEILIGETEIPQDVFEDYLK
jgi:hypothetical protein